MGRLSCKRSKVVSEVRGSSPTDVAGAIRSDETAVHFADRTSTSTINTAKTKLAMSENLAFNGCMWKELSRCLRECAKVFMKTSSRRELSHVA
jgi:hypothetical protein